MSKGKVQIGILGKREPFQLFGAIPVNEKAYHFDGEWARTAGESSWNDASPSGTFLKCMSEIFPSAIPMFTGLRSRTLSPRLTSKVNFQRGLGTKVFVAPRQPSLREGKDAVKVLIADARHEYRRFIKQALERRRDLNVVGEAADGEEAIRLARRLKPDVVLLDIDLRGPDAFNATQYIKTRLPGTKVIMLSALEGETYRQAAAKYGADAFLAKGAEISELFSLIGG